VYISGALGAVLSACERDARSPDLVFPSARSGGPMKGWSKIMDRADVRSGRGRQAKPGFVRAAGVDFTLHDLRRTFRTGLSRLGVDRDIAELALGHARADLEARYNRDDCEAALRAAFEAWAAHVATALRSAEI
jgi:integrase